MHAQLVQDGGISYSCDTPILCHLTGDHHNFKGVVRFYTSCCWGGENSWETHKRENADVGRRRVGHEYNYVAKLYTLEQERRYPMATSSQQRQSAGVKTPASRKPGRLKRHERSVSNIGQSSLIWPSVLRRTRPRLQFAQTSSCSFVTIGRCFVSIVLFVVNRLPL